MDLPILYLSRYINQHKADYYTKIEFVMNELGNTRITATKYLEELCKLEILHKEKIGKENYYINTELFRLLSGSTHT